MIEFHYWIGRETDLIFQLYMLSIAQGACRIFEIRDVFQSDSCL